MEKKGFLKWSLTLLSVLMTIAFTCCEDGIDPGFVQDNPDLLIGPEGGLVKGLEGSVVMVIPAGALEEQVKFSMREVLFKSANNEAELLKTFIIEPSVSFSVPATLKVSWKGCLSNGCTPCEGMDVYFCTWCNLSSYCQDIESCRFACCVDVPNESVSACIGRTGVIATIGIMN